MDDLEIPKVKPNHILIRTSHCSLNPIDYKISTGGYHSFYPVNKFPKISSFDVAGEVIEVGEGITDVVVGDKVCA